MIEEINRLAFLKGVNPCGKPKFEIIRMIQSIEGFEQCFGTKRWECTNKECIWRDDCQGRCHIIGVK